MKDPIPVGAPIPGGGAATTDSLAGDAAPSPVEIRHGTAVRWHARGILLLGPSGAGKSDLALRLVERGAVLVADDLVRIEAQRRRLVASAAGTPGLIELRGQGIFRLPTLATTILDFAVELGRAGERLPEPRTTIIAGIGLPTYRLDPRAASATARLAMLATAERAY